MAARGLGKGLDSLIPMGNANVSRENSSPKNVSRETDNNSKSDKQAETLVKITKVEPNRNQPRKNFDEDALQELADSIKQFGLLQPILVQDKKDYYEIIAGERRWRAAKLAGLKEVPVIIKNYTNQEIVEISLIENIQREDLNPIEEAQAFKRLLEEFNLKQDEVAERVSKSRTTVTNSMRLLKLSEPVQQMIIDGMLSPGHARALIPIEDAEQQLQLAQRIFDEKLSVRDVEKIVKNMLKPSELDKKDEKEKAIQYIYQDLENKLKERLSRKVAISSKGKNGAGKIEIEFYSNDDLDRLIELLSSLKTE
jgi:ParB family chromosome partitioning protein